MGAMANSDIRLSKYNAIVSVKIIYGINANYYIMLCIY